MDKTERFVYFLNLIFLFQANNKDVTKDNVDDKLLPNNQSFSIHFKPLQDISQDPGQKVVAMTISAEPSDGQAACGRLCVF